MTPFVASAPLQKCQNSFEYVNFNNCQVIWWPRSSKNSAKHVVWDSLNHMLWLKFIVCCKANWDIVSNQRLDFLFFFFFHHGSQQIYFSSVSCTPIQQWVKVSSLLYLAGWEARGGWEVSRHAAHSCDWPLLARWCILGTVAEWVSHPKHVIVTQHSVDYVLSLFGWTLDNSSFSVWITVTLI